MSVHVGVNCEWTSGCCGVRQLCEFSDVYPSRAYTNHKAFHAEGATEAEAYANLLRKVQNYSFGEDDEDYSCSVLQIWFYKPKKFDDTYEDTYKAEPLRLLVEQIPGVVELGEHYNVNSGNMIKGYQWSV